MLDKNLKPFGSIVTASDSNSYIHQQQQLGGFFNLYRKEKFIAWLHRSAIGTPQSFSSKRLRRGSRDDVALYGGADVRLNVNRTVLLLEACGRCEPGVKIR